MAQDVVGSASGDERLQSYRYYVSRAQASIDAANAEKLPQRMRIHLEAAKRWTSLAEKAAFVERLRSARVQ
ncbi:hypothetical protein FHS96_005778 [Sphingomonas zeicaulis]|uniref:hypothetical protein n=1 Tax=Sphingomonas zeicaulis TaxID=1632740 RepID=UPI003D1E0808